MVLVLYTETLNRAILMAGLVLSIAVLATGTILPSVEAMKPAVDSATGIKIQCKIPKGGSSDGRISCTLSARDGIDFFILLGPAIGPLNIDVDCEKRFLSNPILKNGKYVYTVSKCGSAVSSVFEVTVEGSQITSVVNVQ